MKSFILFTLVSLFIIPTNLLSQNWVQDKKLTAPDKDAYDYFGASTSISNNYLIVGAPFDEHDLTPIYPLKKAGSAYLLLKDKNGHWIHHQKLIASDRKQTAQFGHAVAIAKNNLLVGAPCEKADNNGKNILNNAGAVYVFEKDSMGNWMEQQKLIPKDRAEFNFFGNAVDLDGKYAIIGAPNKAFSSANLKVKEAGAVYLFKKSKNGSWKEHQKLVAPDRSSSAHFGFSVSIHHNQLIVGAYTDSEGSFGAKYVQNAGSAYIYELNKNEEWILTRKLISPTRSINDQFGKSVSISSKHCIVGALWEDEDAYEDNPYSGSGSAYIFKKNDKKKWLFKQKLVANSRQAMSLFGGSVAITENTAIVSAIGEKKDRYGLNTKTYAGSAYLFKKDSNDYWYQHRKLIANDRSRQDCMGSAVAINGKEAVIGAYCEDYKRLNESLVENSGAIYIFKDTTFVTLLSNKEINNELVKTVSPNTPFNNQFYVSLPAKTPINMLDITAHNILGEKINLKPTTPADKIIFDDSKLKPGIYFLEICSKNKKVLTKIVKQ